MPAWLIRPTRRGEPEARTSLGLPSIREAPLRPQPRKDGPRCAIAQLPTPGERGRLARFIPTRRGRRQRAGRTPAVPGGGGLARRDWRRTLAETPLTLNRDKA